MLDKYKASEAYKALYEAMKIEGWSGPIHRERVSAVVGRSVQTLRQYGSNPDKPQFRLPPHAVIDAMRESVMQNDVYSPSGFRALGNDRGFSVRKLSFDEYLPALDLADRSKMAVQPRGKTVVPHLSDEERLRHQWRRVYFGGVVDRNDLAAIASTDYYSVPWVGREHGTYGVQPTFEMVTAAVALEALLSSKRSRRAA